MDGCVATDFVRMLSIYSQTSIHAAHIDLYPCYSCMRLYFVTVICMWKWSLEFFVYFIVRNTKSSHLYTDTTYDIYLCIHGLFMLIRLWLDLLAETERPKCVCVCVCVSVRWSDSYKYGQIHGSTCIVNERRTTYIRRMCRASTQHLLMFFVVFLLFVKINLHKKRKQNSCQKRVLCCKTLSKSLPTFWNAVNVGLSA